MELFWEYWYWYWLLVVLVYYSIVLEKSVGVKNLFSTPVQYNPPTGFGVLLAGLIYDRFTEHKDFVASILELEVLGLVEIKREKNSDLLVLRTDKSPTPMIPLAQYLLDEVLFVGDRKSYLIPKRLYTRKSQTGSQDTQRYKEIVDDYHKVNMKASQWVVSEGYMEENPKKTRRRFVGWSTLLVIVMLLLTYFSGMVADFFAYVAFFFIYFPLFFVVYSKSIFGKIFAGVFPSLLLWLIIANDELRQILFEELHLWLYIVVLVVQMAFMFTYEYVGTLSPKGKEVRNHLVGFKEFLKRVKKDEVKKRKKEDPEYIDKVLPYMVLFGIEEHELNLDDMRHLAR